METGIASKKSNKKAKWWRGGQGRELMMGVVGGQVCVFPCLGGLGLKTGITSKNGNRKARWRINWWLEQ